MGLWDRVKKQFDSGGVKVRIRCPPAFHPTATELPVAVELRNSTEEPRTVTAVKVKIERDESDREATDHPEVSHVHDVDIELAPGATTVVEVLVPLSVRGIAQLFTGDDVPGWMRQAGKLAGKVNTGNAAERRYRVSVAPTVDGYQLQSWTTTRTRHLKPNERSFGPDWHAGFDADG